MKTRLLILAGCLLASLTQAQGWKKTYPIASVSGLQASSGVTVYLTQGSTESLVLEVNGFDQDMVIAEVRKGQLILSRLQRGVTTGFSFSRNQYIKAYLTVKQLDAIDLSAGAHLEGKTDLRANRLAVNVSSGADLTLRVGAQTLDVNVSSGADATFSGSAGKFTVSASGGADCVAHQLTADVCYAEASGGADLRVYGAKELYLRASGGGDLSFRGPGRVMARKELGGGDISED